MQYTKNDWGTTPVKNHRAETIAQEIADQNRSFDARGWARRFNALSTDDLLPTLIRLVHLSGNTQFCRDALYERNVALIKHQDFHDAMRRLHEYKMQGGYR